MGPHAKLPRLDDVARRAQVSSATVSRFFNNPELLAPKTAERIRAAVTETGYVPNLLAGGLASTRSRRRKASECTVPVSTMPSGRRPMMASSSASSRLPT